MMLIHVDRVRKREEEEEGEEMEYRMCDDCSLLKGKIGRGREGGGRRKGREEGIQVVC